MERLSDENNATQHTAEPAPAKLLGSYPQKQPGLFMQRIKILGGRINWLQWRKVAELAAIYSPGTPLHVTTRQAIELHNVRQDDLPAVHQALAAVGLSLFGAGGDSVRNFTISTGCESCETKPDLMPLAELVCGFLNQQPVILDLPRKFKISFSSCPHACVRPWLNDLGFIALTDGLFTVVGAGSLGPRPAAGIKLYDNLPVKDVLPICMAALELFHVHGDRHNRHKARLRHVREKFGNDVFRQQLDARFDFWKNSRVWPELKLGHEDKKLKLLYRLHLANGNILPADAIRLADAAEPKKAHLRINLEHGIELYAEQPIAIPEDIAVWAGNPVVVACPGSATCPRALANGLDVADKIRDGIRKTHHNGVRINISGCPNNCGHSAAAAIGLIGVLRKINGQSVEHYQVLVGGGNGRDDQLAEPYGIFPADGIAEIVKKILQP